MHFMASRAKKDLFEKEDFENIIMYLELGITEKSNKNRHFCCSEYGISIIENLLLL